MGALFERGVTLVADGGRHGTGTDAERTDVERTDTERTDAERTDTERTDTERTDVERTDAERTDADSDRGRVERIGDSMRSVSHEAPYGGHENRMFERPGKRPANDRGVPASTETRDDE